MAIKRVFLGWDGPCLERAADYFAAHYQKESGEFDMRCVTVVLPGSRAERNLMEILVGRAEDSGTVLFPPNRRTVGGLPELLYTPPRPFAENLLKQATWIQAVRHANKEHLEPLLPGGTHSDQLISEGALAKRLEALWVELSSAGLHFKDVAQRGIRLFDFFAEQRWYALEELHKDYLQRLEDCGLSDRYFERLCALAQDRCSFEGDLYLVATPDLRPVTCEMLRRTGASITALIHAPESEGHCFDPLGCLNTQSWASRDIAVKDRQIKIAGDPAEQALLVFEAIAQSTQPRSAEEITVGVTSEDLEPYIELQLKDRDLSPRSAKGTPLLHSGPARLIAAVCVYLEHQRFCDLAALVRHPDLETWWTNQKEAQSSEESYIPMLDRYHTRHLPAVLDETLAGQTTPVLMELHSQLKILLSELFGSSRFLSHWAKPILDLLVEIYGDLALDQSTNNSQKTVAACRIIFDSLKELNSFPKETGFELSGHEALRFLLEGLADSMIPPEPNPEAVELLGWLELQLDDAPSLIIAGMNEGLIPQSINADSFLPNTLRHHLGLLDNERRYARDSYLLSAILNSRPEVTLICGRRNTTGESLMPSRLLLACSEALLAGRIRGFYREYSTKGYQPLTKQTILDTSSPIGHPPRPQPVSGAITSMSVTSFRDYLRCPYRFYLKHILKLTVLDDRAREMDAALFGTLVHEVLKEFGRNEIESPSFDEQSIYRKLSHLLDIEVKRFFGSSPLPAVMVQAEQLRARLAAFARWQAERYAAGWRVRFSEIYFPGAEALPELEDGEKMELRGTIDRVDYHDEDKLWAVFDYKTGDTARSPKEVHGPHEGEWFDLQLPLYRELLRTKGIEGPFILGYINLAKDGEVREALAEWDEEELEEARMTACQVAENVRNQVFWPPSPAAWSFDDFSQICGVGLLRETDHSLGDEV